VEHQRNNNGHGEEEKDIDHRNSEGIPQKPGKIIIGKKINIILYPHPLAGKEGIDWPVILKGYQDTPNRRILKKGKVQHRRDQQNQIGPAFVELLAQFL
jgi:hypothetical protein